MKRSNILVALMMSLFVGFTACSDDDTLTKEEQEQKDQQELLAKINDNFEAITTKAWAFTAFEPSDDLVAASQTDDATALTMVVKGEQATNFNMVLSFTVEGDIIKPSVAMNVAEADMLPKLLAYQTAISGLELDFLFDTEAAYQAEIRRIIAAPLAADELTREELTNEETGLCIFSISQNDFSALSYEDLVLSQRKLVAGNDDKIYIDADGTLVVEATNKAYGVSKYRFTAQ
ncbi:MULTISPECIES: hypothetical protein [unclassified Carboxylicivirga]|uniref:hypothetical protein n=1 Tax=Carboxylicivirga TaxID=1628153 RepID=UPI003D33847C